MTDRIEKTVELKAPVSRVWKALTDHKEFGAWFRVNLDGPFAHEQDNQPNAFTDYRLTVTFRHESGDPTYRVPGYFAADGNAGQSGAESGTKWRAHLSPDKAGAWTWPISPTALVNNPGMVLNTYWQ